MSKFVFSGVDCLMFDNSNNDAADVYEAQCSILRKWSTSLFRKWATPGNYPDFIKLLAKNLPSNVFITINQTMNNCVFSIVN